MRLILAPEKSCKLVAKRVLSKNFVKSKIPPKFSHFSKQFFASQLRGDFSGFHCVYRKIRTLSNHCKVVENLFDTSHTSFIHNVSLPQGGVG